MRRINSILLFLGSAFVVCGHFGLIWGFWSPPVKMHVLDFSPHVMSIQDSQNPKAALLENRVMTLSYPSWIRLGDSARVRVTFSAKPVEENPSDLIDAAMLYDVFVESNLDMPDLKVNPNLTAGQVLPPGRTVTFWWTVFGVKSGANEGTVWLRLRFVPQAKGEAVTTTLAAPRIELHVRRLAFLSGPAARWLGGLSLFFGVSNIFIVWRRIHA